MLFSTSLVAVALTTLVNAQTYWVINPEDIDLGTKQTWCSNQMASCTLLCLDQQSGGGYTNDCWPDDLSFQCICADNTTPNATEYTQTLPYFLCTYQVENCVQNCGQYDPLCAQQCHKGKTCGASQPSRVRSSSSISGASTKTSAKPTGTNTGDDDTAFDSQPTDDAAQTSTTGDDDAAAVTGDNAASQTSRPSAANRLSSVSGGAMAFSMMVLSIACGAFVFQL